MNLLKISVLSILVGTLCSAKAATENYKSPFWKEKVKISWYMEKLISGVGQEEKYKKIDPQSEKIKINLKVKKLPEGAVEYAFVAENKGKKQLFLRPVITADIPEGCPELWNGYSNMRKLVYDPFDVKLSNWFPACAAYNKSQALVLGINPTYLYSRVESGKLETPKGNKLFIGLPFVIEPGKTFDYSFVVSACRSRYGYRDIVQHWYDVFHKAFRPATDIDPSVISGFSFMFWRPHGINERFAGDFNRRMFGGKKSWDWCYRPFVRGGDWAITDKWSVGWKGWTKEKVDNWRSWIKGRLRPAKFQRVAPMWYLNVCWTEWDLWKNNFPKIHPEKNPRKRRCWNQTCLLGFYQWGNDYAKLFMEGINRIPKNYPEAKGIAWDSCFAHRYFYEEVDGVRNTHHKSFDKGKIFALEGVGVANLLDLNHKNYTGKYRMANVVNFKLVTPYMIGARSDAALYEGSPVKHFKHLLRLEAMRARIGTDKAVVWASQSYPANIRWVDWDDMEPEEARDTYNQLMENMLFCSYFWGGVSAPKSPAIGVEYIFKAVPGLIDLMRQGWQPSPGVDANEDLLVSRYGKGVGSCIAVVNPTFSPIKTKLVFRPEYWDGQALLLGRRDGELINSVITSKGTEADLSIPARKVILIRVCGAGKLDKSRINKLQVSCQKEAFPGSVPYWYFKMNTNDKIDWNVKFYRKEAGAAMKIRYNGKSRRFYDSSAPEIKMLSADWEDDVQAGVMRSCLLKIYEYPVYSTESLTDQQIKKMDMLANLKKNNLAIVVSENASRYVRDEAERIAEWFRFYTYAVGKRYYEPVITDNAADNKIAIKLSVSDSKLKKWQKGKVYSENKNVIVVSGRSENDLQMSILKFLSRLDKVYPYYGKLPMTENLIRMGLGGKTLRAEKAKKIFHPTLLEMLRKTKVKK